MGSIVFKDGPAVDVVYGPPESVIFPVPTKQFARAADRKGRYAQMPDDLRRMHRAMQIAIPPEEFVVAAAGQTGLKATIQTIFGSGQSSPTDSEWHPTDLVVEGARAWVRRNRWQEGGGDGWFGSPIYHDWAVAGAFIRDAELRQWADELFEHPLGRLIEDGTDNYGCVYAPAGTDPRSWPNVEIESESFSFLDMDHYAVQKREAQPGVYRSFRLKWGLWSGEVSIYLPEYWQIKIGTEREHPVRYPFKIARNGREERRFAPPYTSLEADRQFISGYRVVEYTTELPNLPEFIPPTEAGGYYATFWADYEAWEDFARRHNVRAKQPSLGLHAPRDYPPFEPGAVLIPLRRELAEIAWTEGAKPVPQVIGEVPPTDQWEFSPSDNPYWNRSYFQVGAVRGYCFGRPRDGVNEIHLSEGSGNCEQYHRGWVRIPADRKVKYAFGLTVRDPKDTVRGYQETVVYTDGRLLLAER